MPIDEEPTPDGPTYPDGSSDPAVDALVKASPGYPDVLPQTDGDHPVRDREFMPTYAQHGERLTTSWGTPRR